MEARCCDCGSSGRLHARERCRPCYWRSKHEAEKERCPGCGDRARLRETERGPRCFRCRRSTGRRRQPRPRSCLACGELRRHVAHGLCSACYQRDPAAVGVWLAGAEARLGELRPDWLGALAAYLLERCAPAVCLRHLRRVEAALRNGASRPSALVELLTDRGRSGRSPGATARLVETFFVDRGLVLPRDERGRLAAGRRERRLGRCPAALRPVLGRYLAALLHSNERARRRGEQPLADRTIERRLELLVCFAAHLVEHEVDDVAAVARAHVESFLGNRRDSAARLAALRAFFRWARRERLVLADPTRGLHHREAPGFAGQILPPARQAELLRRWAGGECHPNEALVGLLALLHGASARELAELRVEDVERAAKRIRLGRRRHRLPLDPLSADAVDRCLAHRAGLRTDNPHLIVTRGTRAHRGRASAAYLSHVLDPVAVSPRLLRQTRLADLVHRLDPRSTT